MTISVERRGIWRWRWPGAAGVCAVAMVASCEVADADDGPGRHGAAVAGSPVRALRGAAPSPVLGFRLNGITALSAASAWAVGASDQGPLRLIRHVVRWDGRAWRVVPAPGGGDLYGVAAISAADAWAVGYAPGNKALIEHWNGTAWSRVASPTPPFAFSEFNGVAATSATCAWDVGDTDTRTQR